MMVRRFVTPLALLGLLIGLLVSTAGPVAADTMYTCPDKSCSFSVPDYYSVVSSDATSLVFKDANSGGTFTVALVDIPSGSTIQDAATVILTQIAMLNGFQADPAGVQSETVGGNSAASLVYTYQADNGSAAKAKAFFSVYNTKLYLLQFAATTDQEDAFVQSAQDVFTSWQFT